jgi:hypothetical protein
MVLNRTMSCGGSHQGWIQDFVLGGTKVGEGSEEAFPSTILKHFVNVMKCIKTHESSP